MMKITIFAIILGFCAFTAQSDSNFDISDNENFKLEHFKTINDKHEKLLLEYLKRISEYLERDAEKSVENFQKELNNAKNEAEKEIKQFADEKLKSLFKIIEEAEEEFSKRDNNALVCFDKYRPELLKLIEKAKEDVSAVIFRTWTDISDIAEELQKLIDRIQPEVQKLQNYFKKCIRPINPIYTIKCFLESLPNIQESVKSIIQSTADALKLVTTKLRELVVNTKNEIKKIINETQENIQQILADIRKCLESEPGNGENFLMELSELDFLKESSEKSEELNTLINNL